MNVVCNPADASGRDTVLFGYSAQEWPDPFPQLRVQDRDTLFGADNTMNIKRAKGVGHGRLVPHFRPQNLERLLLLLEPLVYEACEIVLAQGEREFVSS
jgi:hypothetical protein